MIEGIVVEAVAFVESIRNISARIGMKLLKSLQEQGSGCDAVYIVIPIDRNRLLLIEREADAVNHNIHVFNLKRIRVKIYFSFEKGSRTGICGITAVEKKLSQNWWKRREVLIGLRRELRLNEPTFGLHHADYTGDWVIGQSCCKDGNVV